MDCAGENGGPVGQLTLTRIGWFTTLRLFMFFENIHFNNTSHSLLNYYSAINSYRITTIFDYVCISDFGSIGINPSVCECVCVWLFWLNPTAKTFLIKKEKMSTNERRKRRRDEREKRSSPRFSRWWISRNKNLRAEMWWPLIVCLIVPTLLCPSLAATAADDRCDWIGRLVLFFVLKQNSFFTCV